MSIRAHDVAKAMNGHPAALFGGVISARGTIGETCS
jgi:hypothetical protein